MEDLIRRVQADGGLPAGPPPVIAEGIPGIVLWMYRWYWTSSGKTDAVADVFLRLLGLDD